jgi:mannose-6-phosphate isomerase
MSNHTPQSNGVLQQPLQFGPIYKETIWGGRNLETLVGKCLPAGKKIGESWEISACEADQSLLLTDGVAGRSLGELTSVYGARLLGSAPAMPAKFPLLCKLIDAHDRLSVQVHPSDSQALANGWGEFGKTECWYIVHAEPGAQIVVGLKKDVTTAAVAKAVADNTLTELVQFHPIASGDLLFIPAGTVHAICANTLIYEVQQTSDTTFRLYDWGRVDGAGKPRTLHIEQSLQVLDTRWHADYKIPPIHTTRYPQGWQRLRVACRYFAMEEFSWQAPVSTTLSNRGSFSTVMVLDGELVIESTAGRTTLHKGQSALLPAQLQKPGLSTSARAHFLVSWVPDLANEIVAPLRTQGVDAAAIVRLGGNGNSNDIAALV